LWAAAALDLPQMRHQVQELVVAAEERLFL
jgi:hypothetical protein